jgi:lysine 2,3-aminomutase
MRRLESDIADYKAAESKIATGFDHAQRIAVQKQRILHFLKASEDDWNDHRWQMANRFCSAEDLAAILPLGRQEITEINEVGRRYRFAVSPYYLSLIDPDDPDCPVRRQALPNRHELLAGGNPDPMCESSCNPVPGVTRRYPDRLVINVTNLCGMYCRFCQRRRLIGEQDHHTASRVLDQAIAYVAAHPEIRDVLLTGGDALMLSDLQLESLLSRLRRIEHVEIIRLGSRAPVTLPQRITENLVRTIKKYHPVYLNTHFNTPAEITADSARACAMLADAGIPLGNQMVLLAGVNNEKFTVRKLNQQLLKLRVKPYYIFHAKPVSGTSHFWVRIEEGLEIMESLRGFTSGLAVPTYIVNGTGGLGKTPILPNYLLYIGTDKAVFRNWEGQTFEIEN